MAPCSTSYSSFHHTRMSERDNIKLRKPAVEKLRRDRINSCIEQLKVILEKEFQQQEPNSKLEKADILEMTVSFLRQQLQQRTDYSQGYSHCWRDSVHFLSAHSDPEAPMAPLKGLRGQQQRGSGSSPACSSLGAPAKQQDSSTRGPVWRPW